jgi:uncharacterized membrane protein
MPLIFSVFIIAARLSGKACLNARFHRVAQVDMLKWILTLVIAIFLLGIVAPHAARFIRFGQLPGDITFRFRGRTYYLPFTTTLVLSALIAVLARLI